MKDTTDFINGIRCLGKLSKTSSLSVMDVVSLYTKIPIAEAIAAVGEFLNRHRQGNLNASNQSLCELLEAVLTMNCFQFNGENYIQIGGTAMGTKVVPSLANIFMAAFEEKYVYTYHKPPVFFGRDLLMM